ncbi:MAG: hypothetical protein OEZ43_15090 [Gammaproteobacteria bacterium]|nr:hypothetical protein [Gammaproteobacteria bacterium]
MSSICNSHRRHSVLNAKSMMSKSEKKAAYYDRRSLGKRISALIHNKASLKELGDVVSLDAGLVRYLVKLAGCQKQRLSDAEVLVHALLLIGTDKLLEIALDLDAYSWALKH